MPNRYCIASGNFADPAIWSTTNGGPGGASVPANGDDIYFGRAVEITNFTSAATANRNIYVTNGVGVILNLIANIAFSGDKKLEIDGGLTLKGGVTCSFSGNSVLSIAAGGLLDATPISTVYIGETALLLNKGTILGGANRPVIVSPVLHTSAKTAQLRIQSSTTASFLRRVQGAPNIETDELVLLRHLEQTTMEIHIESPLSVRDIVFDNRVADIMSLVQHGSMYVSGSIVSTNGKSVLWTKNALAEQVFIGAGDQTINMPGGVTGQSWIMRKQDDRCRLSGVLDLQNFIGNLSGFSRGLTVRGPSNVIATKNIDVEELHVYGMLQIPAGVTVKTNRVIAEVGSTISGAGTLSVKAGAEYLVEKDPGRIQCRVERHGNKRLFIKAE